MSDEHAIALLEEMRLLRGEIDTLRADFAARQSMPPAPAARVEPYTVKEFASIVRRSAPYISRRCKAGRIHALPGKPYLIPPVELNRYLKLA
jgi:hypothetical protein